MNSHSIVKMILERGSLCLSLVGYSFGSSLFELHSKLFFILSFSNHFFLKLSIALMQGSLFLSVINMQNNLQICVTWNKLRLE